MIEAHGLREISADLTGISRRTAGAVVDAFGQSAGDLAATWKRNAKATSGKHGKHYPNSIDFEQRLSFNVEFEVGPNPFKRQGRMSFEEGSVNQPPHLDGAKAADEVLPRLQKRVERALAGLLDSFESAAPELVQYTTKAGVTRMATSAQVANWTRSR